MTPRTAQRAILDALTERGGFCARPTLQQAVEGRGVSPRTFTKNAAKLVSYGALRLVPIRVEKYPEAKAYANRVLSNAELADAHELYRKRCELLNGKALGQVGQEYTRAIFAKARRLGAHWYGTIPQKNALGFIEIPRSRSYADLIIPLSHPEFRASGLLVEVKNSSERFYVSRKLFWKLMAQAHAAGLQPALVTAYLSKSAQEFCSDMGIATLVFGRRIVASAVMPALRQVYGRDTRTLFQAFNQDRPFRGKLLLGTAEQHLHRLRTAEWVLTANAIWERNNGIIPRMIVALREKDWTTYNALRMLAHANAVAASAKPGAGFRRTGPMPRAACATL